MTVKDFLENKNFIFYMLTKDPKSAKHWIDYLDKHPEDKSSFDDAMKAFDKIKFHSVKLGEYERQYLHDKIFKNVSIHRIVKKPKRYKKLIAVAAVLAFVLFGTYLTYRSLGTPEIFLEISSNESDIQLITPNKIFSLSNNELLTVNKDGIINSQGETLAINDTVTYNTLKVPFGKQSQLVLADGSKMWINSGSTVKFPSKFDDKTRTVFLEGEIYMEVSKNELKPFIVKTTQFNVQVYGTSFDINAYRDASTQRVVLVEGSVGVFAVNNMEATMFPNESLEITPSQLIKKTVNTEIYTSWKNGYLIFEKTPVETILFELSRYYNIKFLDTQKQLTGKTWTGKIYLSSNLNDVLETLSILSNSSFKIKKDN